MKLEMLISTVNTVPDELIGEMGIECDAVLINQCEVNADEILQHDNYTVKVFSRKERGVGRSRNLALENASGDILLFADDDIRYTKGYAESILQEFEKHPEADMIIFNIEVCEERRSYWNEEYKRVRWYNRGRYGACSVAMRRDKWQAAGVKFSLLFGGGAKYSNGEDSLFLKECLDAGMRIYATNVLIGREIQGESTWFKGYNDKFFYDRGVLFAFLYGCFAWLWALRFVLTKKQMFQGEITRKQGFLLLMKGIRQGKIEKKEAKQV